MPKVGDVVICIKKVEGYLTSGKRYTITKIEWGNAHFVADRGFVASVSLSGFNEYFKLGPKFTRNLPAWW